MFETDGFVYLEDWKYDSLSLYCLQEGKSFERKLEQEFTESDYFVITSRNYYSKEVKMGSNDPLFALRLGYQVIRRDANKRELFRIQKSLGIWNYFSKFKNVYSLVQEGGEVGFYIYGFVTLMNDCVIIRDYR